MLSAPVRRSRKYFRAEELTVGDRSPTINLL
jgi:hypothetical protein